MEQKAEEKQTKTAKDILASFENYALTHEEILQAMEQYAQSYHTSKLNEQAKNDARLKWLIERSNRVVCELHQMDKSGDNPLFGKREVHLRVQSDLTSVNKYLVEAIDIINPTPTSINNNQ